MMHLFALGAAGGLLCGIAKQMWWPGSNQAETPQQAGKISTQTSSVSTRRSLLRQLPSRKLVVAGAGIACACLMAAAVAMFGQQRGSRGRRRKADMDADGRIPLQDLIRFKERQWFVEELENARGADPNAMLRLAKMYLHGQGCQRNIALAQEWVRKARNMGVAASLDELFATDDPDPRGKLRGLIQQEEKRRQLRHMKAAAAAGYPHHQRISHHTAAA